MAKNVETRPTASLFDEAPAPPPTTTAASSGFEWLNIPQDADVTKYPFTGEPVWLTPDGAIEYLAVWRVTREFKDGRFQPTAFWAIHNGGGLRITFEPLGYRRYEHPIYIPKKRA